MKGWFDAFRCDGGPTLYSFNNRTPVTGDVTIITYLVLFGTLYLAFLVIFPGIRKQRFSTFTAVTLSLFVGAAILVSRYGSSWHVGSTTVAASYRAFSKEKIVAELGAYVGLNHVNVTLRALPTAAVTNWTGTGSMGDVDFNERFLWEAAGQMGRHYRVALRRGLPYPVLTVAEYLSVGQEGFSWGGQYRSAGYFATIMLWTSLAAWLLMNLLVAVVPRYGAFTMVACGGLLLGTNLGYLKLLPERPLVIHLEGSSLHFRLGWCFWLVLVAGALCLVAGVTITMIDLMYPHRFSTVLEVDYDTPYDRHVIIEESHDKRFQKKRTSNTKLEEPPGAGLGSRILRRLSSKTRDEKLTDRERDRPQGVDNQGFEMDRPKSPWRYPFRRTPAVGLVPPAGTAGSVHGGGRALGGRSSSQDSASSMASSGITRHPSITLAMGPRGGSVTPVHHHRDISLNRTPSTGLRHPDKLREVSMW